MRYREPIYRPPSEAGSYLLQVAYGCPHNACTFCGMYKGTRYEPRQLDEVMEDIAMASRLAPYTESAFLCDGDALSLPTEDLLAILAALRDAFPNLRGVGSYVGPKSALSKSEVELAQLRRAGLERVYLGMESGDGGVLRDTRKGVDDLQMLEAGRRLIGAGFKTTAIVLVGLAGKEGSERHATLTARMINEMSPSAIALMTYMPVPGTALFKSVQNGSFHVLDQADEFEEAAAIINRLDVDGLQVFANHASNNVDVSGVIPDDRERMLGELSRAASEGPVFRARAL